MRMRQLFVVLLSVLVLAACGPGGTRNSSLVSSGSKVSDEQQKASDANLRLGVAYMERGELKFALDKLQRAVAYNPYSPLAHNAIGNLYGMVGEPENADKHFREALKLDPTDPDVRNTYGSFLCNQGKLAAAKEQYEKAAKNPFYKTPEIALANLGVCSMRSGKISEAKAAFESALAANPVHAQSLMSLAGIYIDEKNYNRANALLNQFKSAYQVTPESLWLSYQIAHAQGDNERAEVIAERMMNLYPESPQTQKVLDLIEYGYVREQ